MPDEKLSLDQPVCTSDDALVLYRAATFSSFWENWRHGRGQMGCIQVHSHSLPSSITGPCPLGLTLLLLHGGEVLKGERANRGSPERISLHDGFQAGSAERKARNRT